MNNVKIVNIAKKGKEIDRMRATKQEAERGGCSVESLDAAAAAVRRYERCLKDMNKKRRSGFQLAGKG